MIDAVVRRAGIDDVSELIVIEAQARAALVDARGGARWLEEHRSIGAGWAEAVETRTVFAAVLVDAELDVVCGYLVLDVDGGIAVVDQVYVVPGARELGLGDGLLEAAVGEARACGVAVLEGQALPGDRETKNLYERAGITARLITVSTRLV
ncbi:MAG: GNAT family N-acetyltransferase [Acidimicrobiia bacterium]|nr:GNAT family N-acetyltransferase [Acidimicrobiia bacterium]